MWAKLETWGKAHPFALGLIIFAIGAILIYLFTRGSSGSTSVSGQPSDAYYQAQAAVAASGNQLQAAQIAAQAQSNQVNAQLSASDYAVSGQVALAQIQANQAVSVATLGADVSKAGISAQQEVADTASTLTAKVQQAGIDAQTTINAQNNAAATNVAQINANTTTTLAATNAQVQTDALMAQSYANANTTGATQFLIAAANKRSDYGPALSTFGTPSGPAGTQ